MGEKVEGVKRGDDGTFTVTTTTGQIRARSVILALGRAGSPRKLGITGEDLPKVMYRLIEADHYTNAKILVVGGGDSAVEAAMGLAHQAGNRVTLSYPAGSLHPNQRTKFSAGRIQADLGSNRREWSAAADSERLEVNPRRRS